MVDDSDRAGPEDGRQETMRVWHVVEVERVGCCKARNDADLLDSQKNEGSPQNIEKLDCEKEHPQGYRRLEPLRGKADSIVTYEHEHPPGARRGNCKPLLGFSDGTGDTRPGTMPSPRRQHSPNAKQWVRPRLSRVPPLARADLGLQWSQGGPGATERIGP